MSANATLPDPQQAYENLVNGLEADAFFQKMAANNYPLYGTPEQQQKQAQDQWETALALEAAEAEAQVKQAQDDFYGNARTALGNALQQQGLDGPIKTAQERQRDQ